MFEFGYRRNLLNSPLSGWLDHMRWIAAFMVAASHIRNSLMWDAGPEMPAIAIPFYFMTLFAVESVDVFFVLSGLLVGGSIIRSLDSDRLSIRKYAFDRATRLYVVLIPAIILSSMIALLGTVDCATPDGAEIYIVNILFLQNFIAEPLCNNHPLWSLSSEAYFYIAGMAIIVGVYKRSFATLFTSALLLLPAVFVFEWHRTTPLIGLTLWFAGLLPWFLKIRISWKWAILPLLVMLVLSRIHLLSNDIIAHWLIALSLAIFLCSDFGTRKVAASKLAASLAGFSYSLYLVHMPIAQAVASHIGLQSLRPNMIISYGIYFSVLGTAVTVAWLFGQVFENQTGKLRHLLKPVRTTSKIPPQKT